MTDNLYDPNVTGQSAAGKRQGAEPVKIAPDTPPKDLELDRIMVDFGQVLQRNSPEAADTIRRAYRRAFAELTAWSDARTLKVIGEYESEGDSAAQVYRNDLRKAQRKALGADKGGGDGGV